MDIVSKAIEDYCESFGDNPPGLLLDLDTYTHEHHHAPNMLSGSFQGRVLAMISRVVRPKTVLEVGTYTGYSALCLAEGLADGGVVHTIDIDERLRQTHELFIGQSRYADRIKVYFGDAKILIPGLGLRPDLVFIDGAKKDYSAIFDMVLPMMNSGGVILADNVLWKGKVLDEEMDDRTAAIHEFNRKVSQCELVYKVLLPVRDGLFWITKK
ncbi:MAG TPA: O-methyltransferase [Saprospiraceae bacterium]|jgi:predicted O-methyltransferase YrrM|nr:MAG: caffeoyl-CoA O-methyltransferase [Candidatus Parvibacillus calidus]MBX2936818.1 O-methyltransferase [Saprospiraceae bacterium]MBK7739883.1 O-methyltransferase [Candidatus Parvibacillus calidus]MBX7179626.1 O-methyltransferase [Saprospiraceae bacterium]MCB0591681.1 O-methyltransferase [Saprospiraceae bacterium]